MAGTRVLLIQDGGRFQRDLGNGHTHVRGAYQMRNNVEGFLTAGQMTIDSYLEVGGKPGDNATFVQRGNTSMNVDGQLRIGQDQGAAGRYTLNGGTLVADTVIIVGAHGTGSFNLNGGAVWLGNDLRIADNANGRGFFHLDGGRLEADYATSCL